MIYENTLWVIYDYGFIQNSTTEKVVGTKSFHFINVTFKFHVKIKYELSIIINSLTLIHFLLHHFLLYHIYINK